MTCAFLSSTTMKMLLLMPSVIVHATTIASSEGHSLSNARALVAALVGRGDKVDVLDETHAARDRSPIVRLAHYLGGTDAALARMAFQRRGEYDVVFSRSEGVGLALALLFQTMRWRPAHVMVGRHLSANSIQRLIRPLGLYKGVDALFTHAQAQRDFAEDRLGFPAENLWLVPPPVDDHFFRPLPAIPVRENQICTAGLRCRDYPTLLKALSALPELSVMLATFPGPALLKEIRPLPTARPWPLDSEALRMIYAQSLFVVVPLRQTNFDAGSTTILEAMAMGKAVIATRAEGQTDLIVEGVTGLTVPPGDVAGWRRAVTRLRDDRALREQLGFNARRWVEENATQDRWAERIAEALRSCAATRPGLSLFGAQLTTSRVESSS